MSNKNRARASSLFLLELIIAILFFTVASAVCVQFFVKSHAMSNDARELDFAVNECTSVAEIIQTSTDADTILDAAENDLYFDENFMPSDSESCYTIQSRCHVSDGLVSCTVSAYNKDEKSIYSLKVNRDIQGVSDR